MPTGQILISVSLILVALALGINWSWVEGFSFETPAALIEGSPEHEAKSEEYFRIKKDLQMGVEKGTMSVKDMILTVRKGNALALEIGFGYVDGKEIHKLAKAKFIERWQPKNGEILDRITRMQMAGIEYEEQVREAVNEDSQKGTIAQQYGDDCFRVALWWLAGTCFKWYWIMTVPIFLIVLLDLRYAGKKVSEELILRPLVFLKACSLGPIGFFLMDDAPGRACRYNKFRKTFLATKPYGYELSEEENQALLRQAEQPVLAFEEALGVFTTSGQLLRQPAMVCCMVWLMSLNISGMKSTIVPNPQVTVCAESIATPQLTIPHTMKEGSAGKSRDKAQTDRNVLVVTGVEEAPVMTEREVEFQSIAQPVQQCRWNPDQPRGPPESLVWRQYTCATTLCSSGLATSVKEG
ncbi:MAG: hypothetical protein WC640_03320 [Candidatus Paceibacterota bacterium]|jgi:hypothetical protein